MEFAAILIEHEIFGNCSQSIDRSIVRFTSFDSRIHEIFGNSMEFAVILIEKETRVDCKESYFIKEEFDEFLENVSLLG